MDFTTFLANEIEQAKKTPISKYRGYDWWQLSEAEEEAFGIDIERFPVLITVFHAYENFMQVAIADYSDYVPAERERRADLAAMDFSVAGFQAFAKEYAAISYREAEAVYTKVRFWQIRTREIRYKDEANPEG